MLAGGARPSPASALQVLLLRKGEDKPSQNVPSPNVPSLSHITVGYWGEAGVRASVFLSGETAQCSTAAGNPCPAFGVTEHQVPPRLRFAPSHRAAPSCAAGGCAAVWGAEPHRGAVVRQVGAGREFCPSAALFGQGLSMWSEQNLSPVKILAGEKEKKKKSRKRKKETIKKQREKKKTQQSGVGISCAKCSIFLICVCVREKPHGII